MMHHRRVFELRYPSPTGTSSGTMACWDMRFQLPISNHAHPARARIRRLLMHPLYQSSVIAGEGGALMGSIRGIIDH